MRHPANGGQAPGVASPERSAGRARGNPMSAYKMVGLIVLVMVVILFGGFELEIRRRDARLEWIGLAAPREMTRQRVREFYREHAPHRLTYKYSRKLDKLLDKYEGNERELFSKLRGKYVEGGDKKSDAGKEQKNAEGGDKKSDADKEQKHAEGGDKKSDASKDDARSRPTKKGSQQEGSEGETTNDESKHKTEI